MKRPLPFSLPLPPLPDLDGLLADLRPPAWLQDELQNRLILLLNHVLQQEPEAMARLQRQRGKPLRVVWNTFSLTLQATPAGLLERLDHNVPAELTATVRATVSEMGRQLLRGERPAVDIQGDVQLAAEVAWLADNVRWDAEEDLARLLGDAPAHWLGGLARRVVVALSAFGAQRQAQQGAATARTSEAPMSRAPEAGPT